MNNFVREAGICIIAVLFITCSIGGYSYAGGAGTLGSELGSGSAADAETGEDDLSREEYVYSSQLAIDIKTLADEGEHAEALERAKEALHEDEENAEYLRLIIELTGDSFIEDTYDPLTALDAYETLYYLAELGSKEIRAIERDANELWEEYLVDETLNISGVAEKAYDAALKKHLPVYLLFYVDWCPYCDKIMDNLAKVERDMKYPVVILEVDAESGNPLVSKYGVKSYPTNIFIDRSGNEARFSGSAGTQTLVKAIGVITDLFYEDDMQDDETFEKYFSRITKVSLAKLASKGK